MHFVDKHTAAGYGEIPAPRLKKNNYTLNQLLNAGGLFISNTFDGGLNRDGELIREGRLI